MSAFNARFESLSSEQRQERYQALARAALMHYALDKSTVTFLGHNAGVAYSVTVPDTGQRFLLKIAEPVGEGSGSEPTHLRSTLLWLAALARETDLVVQEPVLNRKAEQLTAVSIDDLPYPFYCSLQRWVEGEHVQGDFTVTQTFLIGALLGTLHEHASHWPLAATLPAHDLDSSWMVNCEEHLRRVVDLGILPLTMWMIVAEACRYIRRVMEVLGRQPEVWGPIHGDLHHQNLLFRDGRALPIDFGPLCRAHFTYELGVTLYHVMYQNDASVRRALLAGYHSKRPHAALMPLEAEAFLCAAALSNLAFQVTIPHQRTSSLFVHNVREFAAVFCKQLVYGTSFIFS
jgi:Ser/Thr protein kinase RdoA (MazF antagonist)